MILYKLGDIGCFTGMIPLIDFIKKEEDRVEVEKIICLVAEALSFAADESSWDGYLRSAGNLFIFAVPGNGVFWAGITWKQNHKGVTFVYSPVELPWLEQCKKWEN